MRQRIIPILDNGHGVDTPGKRSPKWEDDTQLMEWEFNRDIVRRISDLCRASGIAYKILVPQQWDVPLAERVRRANDYASTCGMATMLLSIHANAGGGTGWECWTSRGKTRADEYATVLFNHIRAEFRNERMRADYSDGDPDKESDFYILKHTSMPAVLTENWFMDKESDCRKMLDGDFRQRIARAHFEALRYICTKG